MEIEKLQELSLFESIMLYGKEMKSKEDSTYQRLKEYRLSEDNVFYVFLDLKNWNSEEKELLLKSAMVGMNHFYFNLSQKRSLNVGGFNSLLEVINGKESIYLYINSIKWFPKEIKTKILNQGINFPEIEKYNNHKRKISQE
jgi:hypothetical protein